MTDTGHEPTPVDPAAGGRVVLAGAPSPLRSAAAQRLKAAATLLACLDTPAHLTLPSRPRQPASHRHVLTPL